MSVFAPLDRPWDMQLQAEQELGHFATRWWPEIWRLSWNLLGDVERAGHLTGEIVLHAFRRRMGTRRALFRLTIERCPADPRRASMLLLDLGTPLEECASILSLPPAEIARNAYEARLHLMSAR